MPAEQIPTITGSREGYTEYSVMQNGATLVGVDPTKAVERAFWVRVIEKGQQAEGDLAQAMALLRKHGALDAARADALAYVAQARSALDAFPDSVMRRTLSDLADYVVARIS